MTARLSPRSDVIIAPAAPSDGDAIARMTRALLIFETGGDPGMEAALTHLTGPRGPLRRNLFGPGATARAHMARTAEGIAVGFALSCPFHSAFAARPGRLMEGLYVEAAWRGRGVGFALLKEAAKDALEDGGFLEWRVERRNAVGEAFYAKLGAKRVDAFRAYRMDGDLLARLATA